MMTEEINKLKSMGAKQELLKTIHDKLWTIKIATENAEKDCFKNLTQELVKMREALDDAEQLYLENKKL